MTRARKVSAICPARLFVMFSRKIDVTAAQHALDFAIGVDNFVLNSTRASYLPLPSDLGGQAGTR